MMFILRVGAPVDAEVVRQCHAFTVATAADTNACSGPTLWIGFQNPCLWITIPEHLFDVEQAYCV
ncbi:MAG: hypothetical protein FWD83_08225, partial [Promicromonosporaceae bacterium]|nr:hypothetical protein [Promicromonosporaceae bacterium]